MLASTLPRRTLAACVVVLIAPLAASAEGWIVNCDAATSLCTTQAVLETETGGLAATFGLQVGSDGAGPVVFVTTPLGVALDAGMRLKTAGLDLPLVFEVCFPDGCRAKALLDDAAFANLLAQTEAEIQIFAYGKDKPSALAFSLAGLGASLEKSVTLP